MRNHNRWMIAIPVTACLLLSALLSACGQATSDNRPSTPPARVQQIAGTNLSRVILTAQAAQRLGIETARVSDAQIHGTLRKVVPYDALLYDLNGTTWVYTNPQPLTYVRASVEVDFIQGDLAVLLNGPPSGTVIVSVGATELYGTEFGVGD